ncbi:MAG: alpha/beta fold hydrolase, partial [Steroidobacteraceae bacterium]|nr:alpha/beta fold hydrolase [Steroidobacteraceae bacterium]
MGDNSTHIIYVHGLWLNGTESLVLSKRIQRELGVPVHRFHYSSVSSNMADITSQLHAYVRRLAPGTLHLIGHSLGGLVIYRFLERFPQQAPGRVVFLGTPAVTSRAAVAAARMRWIATFEGRCVAEELLTERSRQWVWADRPLGVVAGTRRVGLGQFFARFTEECDGTVAVSETRMPGAADFVTLPVSHMG